MTNRKTETHRKSRSNTPSSQINSRINNKNRNNPTRTRARKRNKGKAHRNRSNKKVKHQPATPVANRDTSQRTAGTTHKTNVGETRILNKKARHQNETQRRIMSQTPENDRRAAKENTEEAVAENGTHGNSTNRGTTINHEGTTSDQEAEARTDPGTQIITNTDEQEATAITVTTVDEAMTEDQDKGPDRKVRRDSDTSQVAVDTQKISEKRNNP